MEKIIKSGVVALILCWVFPLQALTLQNVASINFGTIDYSPPVSGAIQLGTNGTVGYSSTYAGNGIGTAGQIEIQDANGTIVEISCTSGKIAHGATVLDMTNTVVIGSTNAVNWGTTPLCAGTGTVIATHTVGAGAAVNTIFIGGSLTPVSMGSGTYNTTNGGGQAVLLQVLVQ